MAIRDGSPLDIANQTADSIFFRNAATLDIAVGKSSFIYISSQRTDTGPCAYTNIRINQSKIPDLGFGAIEIP